jgi:rhamnogalacturonyl hydrolase YesR
MKIFYILFTISILFNLLVVVLDTIPFLRSLIKSLWPVIIKKFFKKHQYKQILNYEKLENSIVKAAEKLSKLDKVKMVWVEYRGFTERIYYFIRFGSMKKFKKYHYPKAFLFYGLSEYYKVNSNKEKLGELKKYFDEFLNENGTPNFTLNKVDQVPFGLTAINMHRIYKEEKYQLFYNNMYNYLHNIENEDGLILYSQSPKHHFQYYDTLGMIIPFLVEYYKITSDSNALKIAKTQLEYYIQYGVDRETYIPSHGIDTRTNIKTGSINWGRGIGWYLLGLTAYHSVTGEYVKELDGIIESLSRVKISNNLYSQFPGSSEDFDASTSTMFLYSFNLSLHNKIGKQEVLNLFSPYINKKGMLTNTSGDTYGPNRYSKSFGYSELSQGMLLLLLSKANNKLSL